MAAITAHRLDKTDFATLPRAYADAVHNAVLAHLTDDDRALFRAVTGIDVAPGRPAPLPALLLADARATGSFTGPVTPEWVLRTRALLVSGPESDGAGTVEEVAERGAGLPRRALTARRGTPRPCLDRTAAPARPPYPYDRRTHTA